MTTELEVIFAELGLSQYLPSFIEQGFDTWETILDITEPDFDALDVKLGHRRKLQRKIIKSRGLSADSSQVASPSQGTPSEDRAPEEHKPRRTREESKEPGTQGAKRKYRRHPKPDDNAPERPPSAYVIFSNKMRDDLKGRNLSFTEIAKLVGENWQNLSPGEKEPFEMQAFRSKETYTAELTRYKRTAEWRSYQSYLVEFKTTQSNKQQGTSTSFFDRLPLTIPAADLEMAKRPKLDARSSAGSSGTMSSAISLHSGQMATGFGMAEPFPSTSSTIPPSPPSTAMPLTTLLRSGGSTETASAQSSPPLTSSTALPGYHDTAYGTPPQATMPWVEESREDPVVPRPAPLLLPARSSEARQGTADTLSRTPSLQHPRRSLPRTEHRPPLLTSEGSNSRSTASTASTPSLFTPPTPMEPLWDRIPSLSNIYATPAPTKFENQLPPLRPPSGSPRAAMLTHPSPTARHPFIDLPKPMATIPPLLENSAPTGPQTNETDPRVRGYFGNLTDDDYINNSQLDPVSALIKAGEIVDRSSRENEKKQ